MSTPRASRPAGQAPGVVKIRLSGTAEDLEAVCRLLDIGAALGGGLDLIEMSQPYPNRRDSGERVYLTVRITIPPPAPDQRTAATTQLTGPALPPRRPLP